jgi:SSS family solute:Na+ symporter
MAAMMSSSDSMLLSGSSYFTRDLYRPFVDPDASDRREAWIARAGVAVFATLAFVASLTRPGTLIEVGDTAFSGFALLAPPVIVALYWEATTRDGMLVGIGVPQALYLAHVLGPATPVRVGGTTVDLLARSYGGWDVALAFMLLGGLLTVGVSLVSSPAVDEDATAFAVGGD